MLTRLRKRFAENYTRHWPINFHRASHGLFLKRHNLSNRQDAKVAKTNKFDVSACGETTSGKLGVLGVLAVKKRGLCGASGKDHAAVLIWLKTPYGVTTNGLESAESRL